MMIQKKRMSIVSFLCATALMLAVLGIGVAAGGNPAYASANESVTRGESQDLNTECYVLPDNTGYAPAGKPVTAGGEAFCGQYATLSVDCLTESGRVLADTYNGYNSYAVIAGDKVNDAERRVVEIKLRYNDAKTSEIRGTKWEISEDSYKKPVNGVQVGVVGTGALIVQKSYDGVNWEWENTVTGGNATNYHTTNFVTHFKPEDYHGAKDYAEDGKTLMRDGKLTVYSPAGKDLARGVYIKVSFAYEIKYSTVERVKEGGFLGLFQKTVEKTVWHYTNVLEETKFYLANGSGEVAYTNAYVEDAEKDEGSLSQAIRMAGSIKDGHGSNDGFRLNMLGNTSYAVKYRKNGSNLKSAEDGEFFSEPGRYDFEVTTKANTVKRTTLYINERGVNKNIETYFGSGLFTEGSKRVFSTGDAVPVYVAGEAWYRTQEVDANHLPLYGKITNLDTETEIVVGDGADRSAFIGLLTEPGTYRAEFANNRDYFENTMSGDCYRFVFQFRLISADEAPGPLVNGEMLKNNLGVSSYKSGYFGVTAPSAGAGKVTFAFGNYELAYDFAYNYERSFVTEQNGAYTHRGKAYGTQSAVLEAVCKAAEASVFRGYFDVSDPMTYLTVQDPTDDILKGSYSRDIVVFASDDGASSIAYGEPYLNDRPYAYLNADGSITQGANPVRFIQASEFESSSVTLIHIATGWHTGVDYGAPVQSVLDGKNAPGGRYKIVERNAYGDTNEYYAVYARRGELHTSITADRLLNGAVTTHTLTQADNRLRLRANGFILRKAENTEDAYGIVKVKRDGEAGKTYELSEARDLAFDREGSYTVRVVDPLGSSAEYYFEVTDAEAALEVTLKDGEETILRTMAFAGQTVTLPEPESKDPLKAFAGWAADGARFTGTYRLEGDADVTLTAVWLYKRTEIKIYDGEQLEAVTTQPENKVVLPEVTKLGYTLYGWSVVQEDGSIRFYRGQITQVPNVTELRLDAVWMKDAEKVTPELGEGAEVRVTLVDGSVLSVQSGVRGGRLTLPTPERAGLIFAGWLYEAEPLKGMLYGSEIEALPDVSGMTLYALWKTAVENAPGGDVPVSGAGTMTNGSGGAWGWSIAGCVLFALCALAAYFTVRRMRGGKDNCHGGTAVYAAKPGVRLKVGKLQTARACRAFAVRKHTQKSFAAGGEPRRKRGFYAAVGVPAICFALVVSLTAMATWRLPAGIREICVENAAYAAQQEQYAAGVANLGQVEQKNAQREEYLNQANQAYQNSNANNLIPKSEDCLTEEEAFLYALVYMDLLSMGYDAFPATAYKKNGEQIKGFAYSSYEEIFESNIINNNNEYFGCGFIAQPKQPNITLADVEDGVTITVEPNESAILLECHFVLSIEEQYGDCHFIAFNKYFTYNVSNFSVHFTSVENDPKNYNLELGYLYSYDLGRPVYDPNLGKEFTSNGYSVTENVDYDFAQNAYRAYVSEQEQNGLSVDSASVIYISNEAINEYVANNQDESFLGVSPEDVYMIESQISDTQYYVVLPNGEFEVLELPKDPPPKATFWEKLLIGYFALVAVIGTVVVGIAITVGSCGAAGTAASIVMGGAMGAAIEMFMQVVVNEVPLADVNWMKVGVAAISGAVCAIPGMAWWGAALVGGVTNAAMTYIDGGSLGDCLLSFGTGVATGVLIHFGTKAIGKVSSKIADKLGKCFVAGTGVLTAGAAGIAAVKKIEDICVGDKVYSFNEFTKQTEIQEVTQVFTSTHSELVKVTTNNGQVIASSVGHPYYTERGWVQSQNLRAGDVLRNVNGERVVVEQIQHELLECPQTLYNFEVNGNHNYYVAESAGSAPNEFVLVHNYCAKGNLDVVGKAHGSAIHKAKINSIVSNLDPDQYSRVYLNKSLNTVGKLENIKLQGGQRPDIIAIAKNGSVSYWEVASQSQASGKGLMDLLNKMKIMDTVNSLFGIFIPF